MRVCLGWSGSRHYFDYNAEAVGRTCQVYRYDARFHGDSDKPEWGHRVARLAADLHDFLQTLDLQEVTVVGTSMGASTIWSYIELFGEDRIARAVFVDQAPLQNLAEDWNLGSTGCYDAVSLARLQTTLKYDFRGVALGNNDACLSQHIPQKATEHLISETLKADASALGKLMADHTQADWRSVLPRISIPCLNLVGSKTMCFNAKGVAYVGENIPGCEQVYFDAGHWLYIEMPDKFNELIQRFAAGDTEKV
ncbi:TPA: hypothetical protein ACH3X1_006002 [Trebouxia sp. C0004]